MNRLKEKLFIKGKMDGKVKEKKMRRHEMGNQSLSYCAWKVSEMRIDRREVRDKHEGQLQKGAVSRRQLRGYFRKCVIAPSVFYHNTFHIIHIIFNARLTPWRFFFWSVPGQGPIIWRLNVDDQMER